MSTIHKAKGKEFDTVFLMLENFNSATDGAKRLVYVALMTRAKQNLHIHLNSNFLNTLSAENLERIEDREIYLAPNELVIHLTHRDVWLSYFIGRQRLVDQLVSGDWLNFTGSECLNPKGQVVLKFSKEFIKRIENLEERNFILKVAKVNFILHWQKEGTEKEVKIILPELYFEKR